MSPEWIRSEISFRLGTFGRIAQVELDQSYKQASRRFVSQALKFIIIVRWLNPCRQLSLSTQWVCAIPQY